MWWGCIPRRVRTIIAPVGVGAYMPSRNAVVCVCVCLRVDCCFVVLPCPNSALCYLALSSEVLNPARVYMRVCTCACASSPLPSLARVRVSVRYACVSVRYARMRSHVAPMRRACASCVRDAPVRHAHTSRLHTRGSDCFFAILPKILCLEISSLCADFEMFFWKSA